MFGGHVTIAAFLLPCAAVGLIVEPFELNELEREFDNLAYGSHRAHHHHQHRHFRHYHPHQRRHKRAFLIASTIPTTISAESAPPSSEKPSPGRHTSVEKKVGEHSPPPSSENLLPGRHPSVAKKLGHMDQEIRDLAMRRQVATTARNKLEDNVKKATFQMNEAVGIKREMARTEAHLRAEELKLKRLEDDRLRLDRTHGHLVSSLQHVMQPKIQFAETRLKQSQRRLHNFESKSAEWKSKESQFHESSIAALEERRETKARVEAANEALKKALHEKEAAKKQLETAKHNVALNIEGYRYSKTRAHASASEEENAQKMLRNSEVSVKRLSGILNMEQKRVDESMAIGKDRVQGRIHELESVTEKSKVKLSSMSQKYLAWQSQQRAWARRVATMKKMSHETSHDYAVQQQAVLDVAQAKVAYDAESDSDWAWDEWPGAGKRDTDEVQLGAV